jgi:glycosyltransferase involved in cell wall biosynthesis
VTLQVLPADSAPAPPALAPWGSDRCGTDSPAPVPPGTFPPAPSARPLVARPVLPALPDSQSGVAVTVVMTTYNHEAFIEQAIDSVLMQQTDFPCQLVIGEDCSTDRTRQIVCGYARRYPEKVRPVLRETNLGGAANLARLLESCTTRYVALLEGDDYWTSPHKLQKQVEFMEAHPRCAQCFHAVTVFHEDASVPPCVRGLEGRPPIATIKHLLRGNFIHTCSVLFRGGLVSRFPDWYDKLIIDDWTLFVLNAQHGEIGYVDAVMAAYRVHGGGVWSGKPRATQQLYRLQAYDAVNAHLKGRYAGIIRGVTARCCHDLAMACEKQGDLAAAREYALRGLARRPYGAFPTQSNLLRVLMRSYAPNSYNAAKAMIRAVRGRSDKTS